MLEVTDTTVTIRHPKTGEPKTIARAHWYRPDGPPRYELAKPMKRIVMSENDVNIGVGVWTTSYYDDGSGKAWLSERFDEPSEAGLVCEPQRDALALYEKHGAKGFKWPASK